MTPENTTPQYLAQLEPTAEIRAKLDAALASARALQETGTHAQLQAATDAVVVLQRELSDAITAGANPCPRCGDAPHGTVHQLSIRHKVYPRIEIGCLRCPDHRADGFTRDEAAANWNAGPKSWLKAPGELPALTDEHRAEIAAERTARDARHAARSKGHRK